MMGADIYTYIILIFILTFVMGGFITMFNKMDEDDYNDDE